MIDFLFNTDGTLKGVGFSDQVHQENILVMHKGDNKFFPHIAVGISEHIDDETSTGELEQVISTEFHRDGIKVNSIDVNIDGKIDINANY